MAKQNRDDADKRRKMFEIAVGALQEKGWTVTRVPGWKPSERRLSRSGNRPLRATIRTSQDGWLSLPPKDSKGNRFGPLATADRVIVAALDPADTAYVLIYDFPADDIRQRFEDALKARQKAGYAVGKFGGMWVSLFGNAHPVYGVGRGVALKQDPITRLPLSGTANHDKAVTLTEVIADAKRQIAHVAGVEVSKVRISIEV